MPIINQVVKGGGTTPTGTKSITANGVYDVTDFASADVQVPTTAPAHYIAYNETSGVLTRANNALDFTGVTTIGTYALNHLYYQQTLSVVPDCSNIQTVLSNGMTSMFYGTVFPANTVFDLSSLTDVRDYGLSYCFYNTNNLANVILSSLVNCSGRDGMANCFYNSKITSCDLSSVEQITGNNFFSNCFYGAYITSMNLSKLKKVTGDAACSNMFNNSKLTNIDLSSLTIVSGLSAMNNFCYQSRQLQQDIHLYSLIDVSGSSGMMRAFATTGISKIYFHCLYSGRVSSYGLSNIVQGNTGTEIHFPKNLDPQTGDTTISSLSGYPTFGGTNTVLLYDLPSSLTLTGADTNTYVRNPKYDTQTALAWRVGELNLESVYYTSGTADPQVNDTIYSDSACTTAVTTINSIV